MVKEKSLSGLKPEFTIKEGFAYMFGAIGIQLTTVMVAEWAAFFYSPPRGAERTIFVGLGMATAMMIVGRFFDAVSDPIIGYWSDLTRSRLGRRRPFIIFGSLPMAIIFILFWMPPIRGIHWLNFIWGVFFATAFYWSITIVLIPYIALLPEIARTTRGRVKLGVYNAVGMILGLILGILSGMLIEHIGIKIVYK